MATTQSRWDQIRQRNLADPEFGERYARTRKSLARMQEVLQFLDTQRQLTGVSKTELARRIGAHPAAMRRLLTSGTSNPTLRTVLDVMDALGIEMRLQKSNGNATRNSRAERSEPDGAESRSATAVG